MSKLLGNNAEQLALNYLLKQGLTLITQQHKSKQGEIDLIMTQKTHIIFIEVKYRNQEGLCKPETSLSYRQQKRILNSAQIYLITNPQYNNYTPRFDFVSLSTQSHHNLIWIKNAFQYRSIQ